ncbi:unnamed protein product [Clavelina lepadiformis]|uniref:RCC1-like domain-containing protein n=1 Tax=Clavelina lepadiformis TaxID=159417 RepID=A0ABP0GIE8_CLALP
MVSQRKGVKNNIQKMSKSSKASVKGKQKNVPDKNSSNSRKRVLDSSSKEEVNKKPRLEAFDKFENRPCGVVMTLGQGDTGQLGLGEDIMSRKKPAIVKDLSTQKMTLVAAGAMHTVCLSSQSKLYSFGCNDEFALGRITDEEDNSEYNPGQIEGPLAGKVIVQVTAGDSHTTSLTSSGEAFIWGTFRDSHGRIGLLKEGDACSCPTYLDMLKEPIINISSGTDHIALVSISGKVYTMGCSEQGQLGRVARYFANRREQRRKMNVEGQLLVPQKVTIPRSKNATMKPVIVKVFCGSYTTWALSAEGEVFGWGLNNFNQLGFPDNEDRFRPQSVPSLTALGVKFIAGGQHHTLILDKKGQVFVLGRGEYGRLGLGEDTKQANEPMQIPSLKNIDSITAGVANSFAVDKDGNGYGWGFGENLQLTTGNEDDEWTPVPLVGKNLEERRVVEVSAGGQHTALLVADQEDSDKDGGRT